MATRWAVQNGNWSDSSTWDTDTPGIPGVGDDVYANTFTVTIDQNVTVESLRNGTGTGISAGGYFIGGDGFTTEVTGEGPIVHEATGSHSYLFYVSGTASHTLISDLGGVSTGSGTQRATLRVETTGVVVLEGNILLNLSVAGSGVRISQGGAHFIMTGNISGGVSTSDSHGVRLTSTGILAEINGDIRPDFGSGVSVSSSSTVRINGDVYGAFSGGYVGISSSSAIGAVLEITGDLYARSSYAVSMHNTGTSIVTGDIHSKDDGIGLSGGTLVLSGSLVPDPLTGQYPVSDLTSLRYMPGKSIRVPVYEYPNVGGTPSGLKWLTLYGENNPVETDVRAGVAYGDDGQLEGTLQIPPVESVAAGVPIDDTVGTAILSMSDLATITGSQIETAFADTEE